jgi:hypothetical protein
MTSMYLARKSGSLHTGGGFSSHAYIAKRNESRGRRYQTEIGQCRKQQLILFSQSFEVSKKEQGNFFFFLRGPLFF